MRLLYAFLLCLSVFIPTGLYASKQPMISSSEQFVMEKLQAIIEAYAQQRKEIFVEDLNDNFYCRSEKFAVQAAIAAGYVTAVVALLSVMERPQGITDVIWSSVKLVCATAVVGTLLRCVYFPVIQFFMSLMLQCIEDPVARTQFVHVSALYEFIRHWQAFKNFTPKELHARFDDLYKQYIKNGAFLELTEEEAKSIISEILARCIQMHTCALDEKVVQKSHETASQS